MCLHVCIIYLYDSYILRYVYGVGTVSLSLDDSVSSSLNTTATPSHVYESYQPVAIAYNTSLLVRD